MSYTEPQGIEQEQMAENQIGKKRKGQLGIDGK